MGPYIKSLQTIPDGYKPSPGQTLFTLATAKHYLGDGGTTWGSSRTDNYMLNQGDDGHVALARQAVQESLVLLKENNAIPIAKNTSTIFVAGQGADDAWAKPACRWIIRVLL